MCICIYVYLYICISVYVYLYICISVYLYICISVYLSLHVSVYLYICLYVYLSICLYFYLYICLSVYLSLISYDARLTYLWMYRSAQNTYKKTRQLDILTNNYTVTFSQTDVRKTHIQLNSQGDV